MKYRYIIGDHTATMNKRVCDCMLFSKNYMDDRFDRAIRIAIPDDMELTYVNYGCSITDDTRTLKELQAVPFIRVSGHWKTYVSFQTALAEIPMCRWIQKLAELGFYHTNHGFMTKNSYRVYLKALC